MNRKLHQGIKGSLTIEAALVLPIFIYSMMAFLYFFQVIQIYGKVQYSIAEIGREASTSAYIYERIMEGEENQEEEDTQVNVIYELVEGSYFKLKLYEYLQEENIDSSCVKGGIHGFHTYLSTFMKDDKTIDIIVQYQIKIPVLFMKLNELNIVQRVVVRGFTGWEGGEGDNKDQEYVYVTRFGSVYHKQIECTHIKLSIRSIPYEEVDLERNTGGGKYSFCHSCIKKESDAYGKEVYITDTGDRYHIQLNCSGLKRLISRIPISEIEDRTPCKRCYKE